MRVESLQRCRSGRHWKGKEKNRRKKKKHVFESLFLALKLQTNMTESCITQKIQACMTLSNVLLLIDNDK